MGMTKYSHIAGLSTYRSFVGKQSALSDQSLLINVVTPCLSALVAALEFSVGINLQTHVIDFVGFSAVLRTGTSHPVKKRPLAR